MLRQPKLRSVSKILSSNCTFFAKTEECLSSKTILILKKEISKCSFSSTVIRQASAASLTKDDSLKKLPLHDIHVKHGAKFGEFAGYKMPLSYQNQSIVDSHLHTRNTVSAFDVSHMLQTFIRGKNCIEFLEGLVVADIKNLKENQGVLTLMTNNRGGIIDDMIVTRLDDETLYVVSNAGHADKVLNQLKSSVNDFNARGFQVTIDVPKDLTLLAFQGPKSAELMQILVEVDIKNLPFMYSTEGSAITRLQTRITRCGYTGEDGFELSMQTDHAQEFLSYTLSNYKDEVWLAGLGARDTLRLEAGLCLAGSDFNEDITPIQAGLAWTIGKRRRAEGGFPGSDIILKELKDKPAKKRIGFTSKGPCPRGGAEIKSSDGAVIGKVTSGCYSPCLQHNIGMGYVESQFAKTGTELLFEIYRQKVKGTVSKMPFVPTRYYSGPEKK
ncbi:aminomethyltransferase, mitochondrial-like isoform X1 [Argiope bruennichi]|uniref:aminomethyltransferase, mitochondrial-like isoform X1 n=1 Tax=Argiope bruennichi TaxID=94029 RepID=UPI0024944DC8|nr:aminomethyltransferase, mitochondrial-like isoform X1 [Argiope bruennichi]